MQYSIQTSQVENHVENGPMVIRPLNNWQTVLAFGLPTLLMIISFHWIMPWLQTFGLTTFESMVVIHTVPMALLLTAAVVSYYRLDGFPGEWRAFRQRMRFPRLTWRAVFQGLGLFALIMVGYGMFNQLSLWFIGQGWLPLPTHLPALLDPRAALSSAAFDEMVGGQILGNWGVVVLYFIMLTAIIVGEELWWRGYLLPRQEKRYGRFTWVWHGLLWTAFHAFKWWDLIGLLPVCLSIAYVAQRTKNNWPAFIAHYLFNGLALLWIMAAVVTQVG